MSEAEAGVGITPLAPEQWSEKAKEVLPRYLRRPELYLPPGPQAQPMPQALRLFAHHVEIGEGWLAFGNSLAGEDATLEPRLRELAVLRVAWRTRCEYEWRQHVRIAASVGVTTAELYAVPHGPSAPGWSTLERAVLEAADQVVDASIVDEPTWKALASELDPSQLLELLFVIGSYLCFAGVVNSTRLQPDPPTETVDAPAIPPH